MQADYPSPPTPRPHRGEGRRNPQRHKPQKLARPTGKHPWAFSVGRRPFASAAILAHDWHTDAPTLPAGLLPSRVRRTPVRVSFGTKGTAHGPRTFGRPGPDLWSRSRLRLQLSRRSPLLSLPRHHAVRWL